VHIQLTVGKPVLLGFSILTSTVRQAFVFRYSTSSQESGLGGLGGDIDGGWGTEISTGEVRKVYRYIGISVVLDEVIGNVNYLVRLANSATKYK